MERAPSERIIEYVEQLCRQASPDAAIYIDPEDISAFEELPVVVIENDGVSEELNQYGVGLVRNTFVFTVSFVTGVYAEEPISSSMAPSDLRHWATFTATKFKQLLQKDWSMGGLLTNSQMGDLLKIDTNNSDVAGSEITCRAMYPTAEGDPFTLPCDLNP